MESAYDRKFEEMKKYIPFLESMIKRLESTSSASANPRQAQLDKIRSLRDLLLDKNKRMKMENLLKCEQVLVNLYAKVEQKEPISGLKPSTIKETTTSKADLEAVRNKLKTVAKLQEGAETLPEIARANDIELDYTGSKEPALFQRRPNRSSVSPSRPTHKAYVETSSPQSQPRRSYTRVLVSPNQSPVRWSSEQSVSEKPLFSRRSPAPPKIPQINKKEKKMSSKSSKMRNTEGLNITLNVPEKSLNSLNTKDILSRILNCSDGDVDIDTLRELRSQILGELKQTGKNDDISDLILKSYNEKPKSKIRTKRIDDVEEGELSDSESEAIESIYGSLVVVDKDKKSAQVKTMENKSNQQRKIQISFVIKSDKDESNAAGKEREPQAIIDISEFEMFTESEINQSKDAISVESDISLSSPSKNISGSKDIIKTTPINDDISIVPAVIKKSPEKGEEVVTIEDNEIGHKEEIITPQNTEESNLKGMEKTLDNSVQNVFQELNLEPDVAENVLDTTNKEDTASNGNSSDNKQNTEQVQENLEHSQKFHANFYKPIEEQTHSETKNSTSISNLNVNTTPVDNVNMSSEKQSISTPVNICVSTDEQSSPSKKSVSTKNISENVSLIPLLNEPTVPPKAKTDVLSEIDILQALKNEILSDSIALPGSEAVTPALHQPKLTKVASAQEVMPKKRISIEKYKQKTSTSTSKLLFVKKRHSSDEIKKQSLKLTEKECERFNFPKRLSFDSDDNDDISDDEFLNEDKDSLLGLDDIYGDLAPKSPDDEMSDENTMPPVIIPTDPVKASTVTSKKDVDMRALLHTPQPQPVPPPISAPVPQPLIPSFGFGTVVPPSPAYIMPVSDAANAEQSKKDRIIAMDPRVRRDLSSSTNSPNSINPDRTPRSVAFPNMTPSRTPSYMPSVPLLMTPNSRPYEMTPTRQAFELEESSSRKHVYAPSFSICDNRERESSVSKEGPHWEMNKNIINSGRRTRWEDSNTSTSGPKWEDRSTFGPTEVTPRYDKSYKFKHDKYNNRLKNDKYMVDGATTPVPSFGWSDCPPTPGGTFGRQDAPMTPSHPFGRSECPSTPSHPFGRSDCPTTPIHPFGRTDCPPTPTSAFGRQESQSSNHSFNISECPSTPNHPYGLSECPSTPSHSFGRSDCPQTPNHPFGRSEPFGRQDVNISGNQKFTKDPRLNRRPTEFESSSHSETERDYQYERNRSHRNSSVTSQNKYYSGPEVSRNYEKEGSGKHNRNYSSDRAPHRYDRDRRESSLYRNSENDRLYTRNRESCRESRNHNDATRREQRERSIGQSSEDKSSMGARSTSRASSVARSLARERDSDNISLKSVTGRDITINTSVKTSFQNFLASGKPMQVFDYSFDSRRRRASSVGRSLEQEGNVGQTAAQKLNENNSLNKHDRFKRASSMGRELVNMKSEKTLQEIKADFESYRSKSDLNYNTAVKEKYRDSNTETYTSKSSYNHNSFRYKKDPTTHKERKIDRNKQLYSATKNNRDPRMRKEQPSEYKNRYKIDRRAERYKSGIVYSNDNIAKGTIMGSGFGVKNYKIPKIKRLPVEPEILTVEKVTSEESSEKVKDSDEKDKNKTPSENAKIADTKEIKKPLEGTNEQTKIKTRTDSKLSDNISDSETRVTRSKKKEGISQANDADVLLKSRKLRPVLHDTDSDSAADEDNIKSDKDSSKSNIGPLTTKKINTSTEAINPVVVKEPRKKCDEELIDSSFAIDDMEIFSENMGSDPVIENINALIADLDNDLDSSKISNDSFATDIEKMMNTINSPEGNSLGDISELIEKDLNESNEMQQKLKEKQNISTPKIQKNITEEKLIVNIENPVPKSSTKLNEDNEIVSASVETISSKVHEAIVSTTKIDQDFQVDDSCITKKEAGNDRETACLPTPDSTINRSLCDKIEDGLPDSTIDMHSELSSEVTSTYDTVAKKDAEMHNSLQNETLNSIGSLLSILQDKTKIKELLSLLGSKSTENEKIKKKLEKLSEIVSDEEDEDVVIKEVLSGDTKVANDASEIIPYTEKNIMDDEVDKTSLILDNDEKAQLELTKEETNDKKREDLISKKSYAESNVNEENFKKTYEKPQAVLEPEENKADKMTLSTFEEGKEISFSSNEKMSNNINTMAIENIVLSEKIDTDIVINAMTNAKNKLQDNEDHDDDIDNEPLIKTKKKVNKKAKGKKGNKQFKSAQNKEKLITTAKPASTIIQKTTGRKKPFSELEKLQEDIREMFMSDDILNATGIRMCRLAKMVTDNDEKKREALPVSEPIVVLEKVKEVREEPDKTQKKSKFAQKQKSTTLSFLTSVDTESRGPNTKMEKPKSLPKYKPGPKSKSKQKCEDADPYDFDTDSVADTNTTKRSDDDGSDSENESLASSLGSCEVLVDSKKKPKRKRRATRGWKTGVIKQKNRKKKEQNQDSSIIDDSPIVRPQKPITIPDLHCFTDKNYCFQKGISTYDCRLCVYSGADVVNHYKKQHPHTEIPLSRMDPRTAQLAIQQCEEINFQAISKIPLDKYTCRFCRKEFGRSRVALETFFWHIVSSHTGEFKHLCSECVNVTRCPFNLDIPSPPKDSGQLIGYLCGKCNFTQISLENLKTHVIVRHNDEETEVYTINLALMSKKTINELVRRSEAEQPRVLRSLRSNQITSDVLDHDDESDTTESRRNSESDSLAPIIEHHQKEVQQKHIKERIQSKLTFENDEPIEEPSVKMEQEEHGADERDLTSDFDDTFSEINLGTEPSRGNCDEIVDYPHFKLNYTESGAKEYVCCINGKDLHYKTSLLISMKKHVQSKHSEIWDGYCCLCKVIVTLQGVQSGFKDCLTHFLDKHMDDFPVLEKVFVETTDEQRLSVPELPTVTPELPPAGPSSSPLPVHVVTTPTERTASPNYIAVRPLSDLISKKHVQEVEVSAEKDIPIPFPKIENVISLGDESVPPTVPSPVYPTTKEATSPLDKPFLYEEVQADVMSKKHRVVLDGMMSKENLVRVFKCAGRFCSFTSDSAEDALLHATTHQRVGGEGALNCAYCNYDACDNGIDLVMHVFKEHSNSQFCCPMCFYRSTASQLVGVHYAKAHGGALRLKNVLRSTAAVPQPAPLNSAVLTREVAVQRYVCNHDDGACNFRTYTPGKYIEHLQQKHAAATSHPCNICEQKFPTGLELVVHLRSHGMRLYQCTWCVHGANNEAELLSHAAARHPHCQPQAYVRVITNKDGSSQRRVLPLAFLNKSNLPTEEIKPNSTRDNPVREAERSIELEKLIGHTMMMIEASTNRNTSSPVPEIITDEIMSDDSVEFPPELPEAQENDNVVVSTDSTTPGTTASTVVGTPTVSGTGCITTIEPTCASGVLPEAETDNQSEKIQEIEPAAAQTTETTQEPLLIKSETIEIPKGIANNDEIICLDSDDEETDTMAQETTMNTSVGNKTNVIEEVIKTVSGEVARNSVTDDVSITKITNDGSTTSDNTIGILKQNVIDLSEDESSKCPSPGVPKVTLDSLLMCPKCFLICKSVQGLKKHVNGCTIIMNTPCPHKPCSELITGVNKLVDHYMKIHRNSFDSGSNVINCCGICKSKFNTLTGLKVHFKMAHKMHNYSVNTTKDEQGRLKLTIDIAKSVPPPRISGRKTSTEIQRYGFGPEPPNSRARKSSTETKKKYGIDDIDKLPISPILDTQVYCELCEFGTKVRLNMVRHLQQHAGSMPVPRTEPVNPVPHLESNEKHFDKMVNLASSSVLTRAPDKPARQEAEPAVTLRIPPGESSRYPKYVPERQRYTCGANSCSYISVDMVMFRRHWETLHAGAEEYRCVHCPPNQALDTSIPLTATRILAHLRMHDVSLYACSFCSYYHYRKHLVERHLSETHKSGSVKIVREESQPVTPPTPTPAMGAPTMDLKAWQCGLCKFNSMFRPEVVNHCGTQHQSKMQFKCAYCPFRTSNKENVIKHQSNAHPGKVEEIFYYFYSEGSIPDDADGVPRWLKQRQKLGLEESGVKAEPEPSEPSPSEQATLTPITIAPIASTVSIDLNLVKKEAEEAISGTEMTIEDLLKKFGKFCDPDGIKYKCCLCSVVREHTREAMQCHLYEELNYRRWECAMCSYKAFHKAGLNDHMSSEHSRQYFEPRALAIDVNVEKWVLKLLDHQASIIETNRQNLAVQKIHLERVPPVPPSSRLVDSPKPTATISDVELEQAFGDFGAPRGQLFSCPKCDYNAKDETDIRYHLESELTKIRWGCTCCASKFQTFHEAQFHCKSAHIGQTSRPKEAIRDPSLRSGWISAVIATQKQIIKADVTVSESASEFSERNSGEDSDTNENSLLVALYDEPVTTEEQLAVPAKRPAPSADSDDERLVIEEIHKKKIYHEKQCPYCDYHHATPRCIKDHILRHYNLKPFQCGHCPFDGFRATVHNHLDRVHPGKSKRIIAIQIPNHPPPDIVLKPKRDVNHAKDMDDASKLVCLYCEKSVGVNECESHTHGNDKPEFARRGALVVKCCKCLVLRLSVTSLQEHFDTYHPSEKFNYAYFKLQIDTREIHCCGHCYKKFKFLRDLKAHHMAIHSSLSLTYTSIPFNHNLLTEDIDAGKRKIDDSSMAGPPPKRVARKSTTKLPRSAVAKKSTTKLPFTVPEELSYYGTNPLPFHYYENVTIDMPMNNTVVKIDVKNLSRILKIDPKVVIRDCENHPY